MSPSLDEIYGTGCPDNPNTVEFNAMLQRWHEIAESAGIRYSISYGTLLGWYRHKSYIPYDHDLDIHIGTESVDKLLELINNDWCVFNKAIVQVDQSDITLIINFWHNEAQDDQSRPRYNCQGKRVSDMTDVCSFNGPIGRLVHHSMQMDIYVLSETNSNGEIEEYIPSEQGVELPEISPCELNNVSTYRFKDSTHYLEAFYGSNFNLPIYAWRDDKWVDIENDDSEVFSAPSAPYAGQTFSPESVPTHSAHWHLHWNNEICFLRNATNQQMQNLNQAAALVWSLCDGELTLNGMEYDLAILYPGNTKTVIADLHEILYDFLERGVIENLPGMWEAPLQPEKPAISSVTPVNLSAMFPDYRDSEHTPLRQCQLVMIRMFKIFDYICNAYDIDYFMIGGTLIGALRHRGFIPFDGDIDLGMLDSDYEKFIQVGANLLPNDMFLQNPQSDETYPNNTLVKLRDRYSCYTDQVKWYSEYNYHHGLQVDIFVFKKEGNALTNSGLENLDHKYSDVFPVSRMLFEGFYPMCPRYSESFVSQEYPDFKQIPPIESQHPHEGASSATTPCDHPMSLVFDKNKR